jgi:hypothetical protein
LAILTSILAIKPNTFDYIPLVFGTNSSENSFSES